MPANYLVAILENLIQSEEQKFADETGGKETESFGLLTVAREKTSE
jgi:hypothetical protein